MHMVTVCDGRAAVTVVILNEIWHHTFPGGRFVLSHPDQTLPQATQ